MLETIKQQSKTRQQHQLRQHVHTVHVHVYVYGINLHVSTLPSLLPMSTCTLHCLSHLRCSPSLSLSYSPTYTYTSSFLLLPSLPSPSSPPSSHPPSGSRPPPKVEQPQPPLVTLPEETRYVKDQRQLLKTLKRRSALRRKLLAKEVGEGLVSMATIFALVHCTVHVLCVYICWKLLSNQNLEAHILKVKW